jgi:hypothetical protein
MDSRERMKGPLEEQGPPAVPWTPQPWATLTARLPKAFEKVYTSQPFEAATLAQALGLAPTSQDRPGLHPESVFDTQYGVRVILSRERRRDGSTFLHASASVTKGTQAWYEVFAEPHTFFELTTRTVRVLSGVRFTFAGMTAMAGIPHYEAVDPRDPGPTKPAAQAGAAHDKPDGPADRQGAGPAQ